MEYNPNPPGSDQTTVVHAPVTPVEQHRKDGITAMVLGIIGLAISWWGVFTIAAFILSILGFVRANKNRDFARKQGIVECGQNKAGYICGLIGLILSAIAIFFMVVLIVLVCVFGAFFISDALPAIVEELPGITAALPSLM